MIPPSAGAADGKQHKVNRRRSDEDDDDLYKALVEYHLTARAPLVSIHFYARLSEKTKRRRKPTDNLAIYFVPLFLSPFLLGEAIPDRFNWRQ